MNLFKKIIFLFSFVFMYQTESKTITIGSKIFTENVLLGEMLSLLLEERYQYKVSRFLNIGGTKLVFDALQSGKIDVYPEYTGTGYIMILNLSEKKQADESYRIVKKSFLKKYKMFWSQPLGFNNTYALAVRSKDTRFKDIYKISDLNGRVENFSLGVGHEFMERKDGYNNFSKYYNMNFSDKNIYSMDPNLIYMSIHSKKIDMIMSYSTDGRIQTYNLKLLKDDKKYFPSYQAAYLTRTEVLKKFPKLQLAFKDLENNISQKEMIELNRQVDQLKREEVDVVREFLISKKLLEYQVINKKEKSLWGYYVSKRKYLWKIFVQHFVLTFSSLGLALFISLPVGILMSRKESFAKIIFPIVNTLQTIPSLALLGFLIPFLGIGYPPALFTLFIYSLLPLVRNTYEGLKGVDKNFIEFATGIGLTKRQILKTIELPLALPVIIAGVKISAVIVVGTATLAALVGAGGLGEPIFRGLATVNSKLIFLGAVPAAGLAVFLDRSLTLLERKIVSKGLRFKRDKFFKY
ncbi:MAG: glycine betaine ABC transporter substrate-binding protein [Bdellovibrionales bacterium]